MRVLIVEDDVLVAEDLRNCVINLGHDVVGVEDSGEDGIRSARLLRPDLVLMDVRLRGRMNGLEAGRLIESHLESKVVYVTANPDPNRMRYHVAKPFSTMALVAVITAALG